MRKIIIVSLLFLATGIINSCCNEYHYKSTLSKVQFVESTGLSDANGTWVLVNFRIVDEFTAITMGSFITQSKADGTICTDETVYEAYEDPIDNVFISCDKDLQQKKANENLTDISFGYYLSKDASARKQFAFIRDDLNDVFKPSGTGRDVWLELPVSEFPETGNYRFTLKLQTVSGNIFEATSGDIYMVR